MGGGRFASAPEVSRVISIMGVARILVRGDAFGGRPRGKSGVRRIFKSFLKKIAKMHYFSIFFKKCNKPFVNFSRVWTKNTLKILDENSIEKLNF